MLSRRQFIYVLAGSAAGAVVPVALRDRYADSKVVGGGHPSDTTVDVLDCALIPKFASTLPIPAVMPKSKILADGIDYYEIALRQFRQQYLPAGMPSTTVWGYGSVDHPDTFGSPTATIEARSDVPVRVKWVNDLVEPVSRKYLQHLLPHDPTLHWANPGGPVNRPATFDSTPGRYTGPVPMVTHLHGAHTTADSDGYAESWWLPDATNLHGWASRGNGYTQYDRSNTTDGTAVFQYPNDQRAMACFFHDHSLGITRLNVYAGPIGYWFIRGGAGDLEPGVLPAGTDEIPLIIQDRSFYTDGHLFYPDTREYFDGWKGPYLPDTNGIPPIWQPEFFAGTMVVNGTTWPKVEVEQRRYRLRILNACGSRFVRLKIVASDPSGLDTHTVQRAAVALDVIGTDGGFLPAPSLGHDDLLVAPSERYDVIVDFSSVAPGTELFLVNEGPDEPFGGGLAGVDYEIADAATTRQVMKIVVGRPSGRPDATVPADQLRLPAIEALSAPVNTRRVSLNEDAYVATDATGASSFEGPIAGRLGTVDARGMGMGMMWMDPATEKPLLGATEDWEICNFTMDAHPIHVHLVEFEVIGRAPMTTTTSADTGEVVCSVAPSTEFRPPEPLEAGRKDTVVCLPNEITRIRARFDLAGEFAWHCHILEHEDNDMMRPLPVVVGDARIKMGELTESVLACVGGRELSIRDSVLNGLVSTGPRRIPNLMGSTRLGGLRVHHGISVNRTTAAEIRNGITQGNQKWIEDDLLEASKSAAEAGALPGAVVLQIPKIAGSRTIVGQGLTVVETTGIELFGANRTLVLQGGPLDRFVVNVSGSVSLTGQARVQLVGILPSQVLVNLTGRDGEFALTGGSAFAGTVLSPGSGLRLTDVTMTGSLVGGSLVQIVRSTIRSV